MRIKWTPSLTMLLLASIGALLAGMIHEPAYSQNLRVTEGSISIRALAERQRRLEEAEFLNRLNPGSAPVQIPGLSFPVPQPGDAESVGGQPAPVQSLPPVGVELVPVAAEPEYLPNTVLSVYGPEGQLTAEVAQRKGQIEKYRVGDGWAGYKIVDISRDGISVSRGGRVRVIAVGARL